MTYTQASKIEQQIAMEEAFHRANSKDLLREDFLGTPQIVEKLKGKSEPEKAFLLDLLVRMSEFHRATPEQLIGALRHHFKDEKNPFQSCADELLKATDEDFVDLEWNDQIKEFSFVQVYVPDLETEQALYLHKFPMPLIVKPRSLDSNNVSGYWSRSCSRKFVILNGDSNQSDYNLEHLNRMNSIALTIDMDIVRHTVLDWKSHDKRKPGESYKTFKMRQSAYKKYKEWSIEVIEALKLASDEIYLTHSYDKRGRCYVQGYHVNPQGASWNKAPLEFSHTELPTENIQ